MRKSRFSPEQIVGILYKAERGGPISEVCRRHGITQTTLFHRWRRKYGGMQANEAQAHRALEEENRRLKRLVADQALSIQVLKDLLGRKW